MDDNKPEAKDALLSREAILEALIEMRHEAGRRFNVQVDRGVQLDVSYARGRLDGISDVLIKVKSL